MLNVDIKSMEVSQDYFNQQPYIKKQIQYLPGTYIYIYTYICIVFIFYTLGME
jgi:hypothetical protein